MRENSWVSRMSSCSTTDTYMYVSCRWYTFNERKIGMLLRSVASNTYDTYRFMHADLTAYRAIHMSYIT